jgi:tRNA dimethylallyltransferase
MIILIGPTGVGKTDVGFELAKQVSGEIVSADSRLVFRWLDIGTAKPGPEMRSEIPHHMIDIVDPDEDYTCKRFEIEARQVIREVTGRRRVPIVVGGSGLYVRALMHGVFDGPGRDDTIRTRLREDARRQGASALWQKLNEVDPHKASQIDPSNVIRTIRALEVYELTGTPMSELEKEARPLEVPHVKVGLTRARNELYKIIERRVDHMMELGFLHEVTTLLDKGYGDSPAITRSLGYSEMKLHLEGVVSLEEAVRLIKRNTRHFAKRQMTWFRREADLNWLDITGRTDCDNIARDIAATLL